jgi:hypothetical protein
MTAYQYITTKTYTKYYWRSSSSSNTRSIGKSSFRYITPWHNYCLCFTNLISPDWRALINICLSSTFSLQTATNGTSAGHPIISISHLRFNISQFLNCNFPFPPAFLNKSFKVFDIYVRARFASTNGFSSPDGFSSPNQTKTSIKYYIYNHISNQTAHTNINTYGSTSRGVIGLGN